MEKLSMCRICLAENIRMYVVVNKNLHELYERLTDIPFVNDDSRPILACFFCCAKLKQSFRLLRKCLEAEERFAQIMNGNYEPKPLSQDLLDVAHGFICSPIESISIVEVDQAESIVVKEELPAYWESQDDILEPKEDDHCDDLKLENLDNSRLDEEHILVHGSECDSEDDLPLMEFKIEEEEQQEAPKEKRRAVDTKNLKLENLDNSRLDEEHILVHGSECDSEDDLPLMEFKIEEEEQQEAPKEKRRAVDTKNLKLENLDNSRLDEEDILAHGSECDSEDDLPLMELKIEEEEQQEAPKEKRRAVDTKIGEPAAKKPKLDMQKDKNEDLISPKHMKKGQEQTKNTENIIKSTCKTIRKTTKNIACKNSIKTSPKVTNNTACIREKNNIQTMKSKENTASFQCNNVNKDEFKCKKCSYSGINSSDIRHNRLCDKDRPYKCEVCQSSFSRKSNLDCHTRVHTGEKPYKCDVCHSSFSQNSDLKIHIRTHTGEKPYKCDICQKSFSQKGNLDNHIRTHTSERPCKCDVCQRSFSHKSDLKRHIRTHTGEKPYKCDICQRSFCQKTAKETHIRTHTGEKPYKCDICHRSFSTRSNLKIHIRTHTSEKPYKCDVCQRSYRQKGDLKIHTIRTHTNTQHSQLYKCDVCLRSFSQKGGMKSHMRTHTREKPYKCDVCQRSFRQKSYLKKHFRTHTGEKPYKCDVCQRRFRQKGGMEIHMRTHTSEKPYKCDVCQRSFSQKSDLKKHFRTHTGEKPYKCDICHRSFSDQSNLKKHIRTHTGEKTFKCDVCHSSFSRKDNLETHIRTHTDVKPNKCDTCPISF